LPAHVFVCSRRVLTLLTRFPRHQHQSFKDGILPLLCKAQWQPTLLEKVLSSTDSINPPTHPFAAAYDKSSTFVSRPKREQGGREHGVREPLRPQTNQPQISATPDLSASQSDIGRRPAESLEMGDGYKWLERIGVTIWTKDDGIIIRGNTVESWLAANRAVSTFFPPCMFL
jgi:hypothetical protein